MTVRAISHGHWLAFAGNLLSVVVAVDIDNASGIAGDLRSLLWTIAILTFAAYFTDDHNLSTPRLREAGLA